jgi:hypothetical protein
MPFWHEQDIDTQIAQTGGVDVTLGAVTVKGLVDIADESLVQGAAATFYGKTVVITVKTGAFGPELAEDAAITADGVAYRVQQVLQIDDGALTVIHAARTA